ncbi:MAG: hypothetical protein K2H26_04830, partial [Ruminococcus sp.]|nr:hypothetical protein [Ruminococcus sp.]
MLENQHNFTTTKNNEFTVEYGENSISATYGNANREISYEDLGNAFLNVIEKEYSNIMNEPDDDFSDIDTKPIFKSLEEMATDSPFIQQVISDVEHLTKMFETSEQNETVSDSPEEKQMSLFNESENTDKKNKEETHVSEPTADNVENEPDNTDFDENAVKYAFDKIMEEHKYDFTNPTFMYLGHLQNYMIDNKIDDIVTGIFSETLQKHYGNAPLTEEYFSAGYTLSKNLPEEYNTYFQEY